MITNKDIFCDCQLVGKENKNDTETVLLCCAHLNEGRCYVCKFKDLKAAKYPNSNGGCCEDATEPKE